MSNELEIAFKAGFQKEASNEIEKKAFVGPALNFSKQAPKLLSGIKNFGSSLFGTADDAASAAYGPYGAGAVDDVASATATVTPGGVVKAGDEFGAMADEVTDLATVSGGGNAAQSSFLEGINSFSDLPLRAQQGIVGGGLLGGGALAGYGMAGDGGSNQQSQPRYRV